MASSTVNDESLIINDLKTAESLNKINQIVNENEQKLWRNKAYAKCFKQEYDKLMDETKMLDGQIKQAELNQNTLEKENNFLKKLKDDALESKRTLSFIIPQLIQRKRDAEYDLQEWKVKCNSTYKQYYNIYLEQKREFEIRCPLWCEWHQLTVEMKKQDIEIKTLKQKIAEARRQQNTLREIRHKMFNTAIVKFVAAVKNYHMSQKATENLKYCEDRVKNLLQIHEEKIRNEGSKKLQERNTEIAALFSSMQPIQQVSNPLDSSFLTRYEISMAPSNFRKDSDTDSKINDQSMLSELMERCKERNKLLREIDNSESTSLQNQRDMKAISASKRNETQLETVYTKPSNPNLPTIMQTLPKSRSLQSISTNERASNSQRSVRNEVQNIKDFQKQTSASNVGMDKSNVLNQNPKQTVDSKQKDPTISTPKTNFKIRERRVSPYFSVPENVINGGEYSTISKNNQDQQGITDKSEDIPLDETNMLTNLSERCKARKTVLREIKDGDKSLVETSTTSDINTTNKANKITENNESSSTSVRRFNKRPVPVSDEDMEKQRLSPSSKVKILDAYSINPGQNKSILLPQKCYRQHKVNLDDSQTVAKKVKFNIKEETCVNLFDSKISQKAASQDSEQDPKKPVNPKPTTMDFTFSAPTFNFGHKQSQFSSLFSKSENLGSKTNKSSSSLYNSSGQDIEQKEVRKHLLQDPHLTMFSEQPHEYTSEDFITQESDALNISFFSEDEDLQTEDIQSPPFVGTHSEGHYNMFGSNMKMF